MVISCIQHVYRALSLLYRTPRQLPGSFPAAAKTISSETSFRELISNTGDVNIILVLVLFQHSHNDSYVMYDASEFGSQTGNVDIVLVFVIYIYIYYIMHSD